MDKAEFLARLRKALGRLHESEAEKSVMFYEEMIDDRMEEGEDEQAVVASLGSPEDVAASIIEELPPVPKALTKSKTRSSVANWVIAIVSAPIWIPLAFALLGTAFMVYLTIWMLIVTVWLVAVCLLLAAPLAVVIFVVCLVQGSPWLGSWELGGGLVAGGLGVFCLYGAMRSSVWLAALSRRFALKVLSLFRKEPAYAC